jgi:hypothetical protein
MAEAKDPLNLTEAWTRLNEANVRYYSGYARLVRDYADEVVSTMKSVRRKPDTGSVGSVTTDSASVSSVTKEAFQRSPETPPVIALESSLGTSPAASFAITNDRDEKVSSAIEVSQFTAPDGSELSIPVAFEPATIELDPGAQMLVNVTADIEKGLRVGVPHRADVTVPDLPTANVELVVRRTAKK